MSKCIYEDMCNSLLERTLKANTTGCSVKEHCTNYKPEKQYTIEPFLTIPETAVLFQDMVRFITEGTLRTWTAENFEAFINEQIKKKS